MNNEKRDLPLSTEEISHLVAERLPNWKKACENSGSEMVILSQSAFGTSQDELLLLAVAIKYAGAMNKAVTIASEQ